MNTFTKFPATVSAPDGHATYEVHSLIGKGGYGEVYRATSNKYPNFEFALKVSPISPGRSAAILSAYESEVEGLKKIDHPNVVRIYDFFKDESESRLYIVLEYCPGGDLEKRITKGERLSENDKVNFASQIASAIEVCHSQNIAHRDLKTSNILFDAYGRCKVADFGLCKELADGGLIDQFNGSLLYAPPEILRGVPHSPFAADIWSLGVLFYRLATGSYPWPLEGTREGLRAAIMAGEFRQVDVRTPLLSVVRKMIVVDPARRITIQDLMQLDLWKVGIGRPMHQIRSQKSIGDFTPRVKSVSPIPAPTLQQYKSVQALRWRPAGQQQQRRKQRRFTNAAPGTFTSQVFNLNGI